MTRDDDTRQMAQRVVTDLARACPDPYAVRTEIGSP